AVPSRRRRARRSSLPGKYGPTRRRSNPPKQKCTRTNAWSLRVRFRSTPSALFLAVSSRSTPWAAKRAYRRCDRARDRGVWRDGQILTLPAARAGGTNKSFVLVRTCNLSLADQLLRRSKEDQAKRRTE